MCGLDQYGLARAEMDAIEAGSTDIPPAGVEDRIDKARWAYVEACHKYRHRKSHAQRVA
jgi:hypothetical protein